MSDGTLARHTVSAEGAQRAIAAGMEHARKIGVPMTIVVVDEGGNLKALARMDGTPLMSIQMAQGKALTAAGCGMDTHSLYEFAVSDPPLLAGMVSKPGVVAFGGGVPLMHDGAVVGAVGVSGGHYNQDAEVAQAAAAPVTPQPA